jgi:hypothetical protein
VLRFVEIALFLAPFVAFALWRLLAPGRPPSRRMIASAAGVLVLLALALLWLRRQDAEPGTAVYVPSQLQDGRILPPRGEPR